MKQILPFVLIAVIVGGALFFLQDDYQEEVFDPIVTETVTSWYWEATFFLDKDEEEEYQFGLKLTPKNMKEDTKIEALEFFAYSMYGSLIFQDMNLNANGDFEIIHTNKCFFCYSSENNRDYYAWLDLNINWIDNGILKSDSIYADIDWREYFEQ